jgi:hypothetical protein
MQPGLLSPDKGNLQIGKGFLLFQPDGVGDFYCLGNCPVVNIGPKVTLLDHFDSQAGIKTLDQRVVTERLMEVKVDMEEITAKNLALLMTGTVDDTDPLQPIVNFFAKPSISGHFKFYAANQIGPRWYVDIPTLTFFPTGAFDPVGDKYTVMQVTGTVFETDGSFGSAQLKPPALSVVPENVLLPSIDGGTVVGDVLTAIIGAWIGGQTFTYVWKRDGTPISGATSKTYTTVVADETHDIEVTVTATNTNGPTSATSAAIGPITAY